MPLNEADLANALDKVGELFGGGHISGSGGNAASHKMTPITDSMGRSGRARVDSQARPAEFFKPGKFVPPPKMKPPPDWSNISVHGINEPALRQRLESKAIGQDAVDKVTEEFKVHDKLTSDDKTKLFELVQLAHHKHSQHDDRGAEEIYSKVLEADPLDFECLTNLGKISYSRGDLNKARELFEKAVVVKPEREKTMYHLAIVLYDIGNIERAKILFEQVVQGYSGGGGIIGESADQHTFHNSIAMLGLIHQLHLQDADKAEKLYKVVLKDNPDHILTLDHKCALFSQRGSADEAAKLHRRICNLDPNHTRKSCPYLDSLFPEAMELMHEIAPMKERISARGEDFAIGARIKSWTNHPLRSLVKKIKRILGQGKKPPGGGVPVRTV